MSTPPTKEQLTDWRERVAALDKLSDQAIPWFGAYEVANRINTELAKGRTLQGGCAYRTLRWAKKLRDGGYTDLAETARKLAQDMIPYENIPSPGWKTMCDELGFEHTPVTNNDY